MATLLLGIASLPVWAAADGWTNKSPQREDSSSSLGDVGSSPSLGDVGSSLRKSQSDTSLETPARKGISSPSRGRGATTGDMPSIHDPSQPHGFDMDQVVINQHAGRAAGKGNMPETAIALHAQTKFEISKAGPTLQKLNEAREQLAAEKKKHPLRPTEASKARIAELEQKIKILSKQEEADKLRVRSPEAFLDQSRTMVKRHFPDRTDAQIDAIPAGLPKHEDALKRKQQKMTDEANRKVKFAPTPTR